MSMEPLTKTLRRHPLPAVFLLLALWMVALRWQLRHEPLDRDISMYAVIGRELLAGRALYSDLWDHKPPAVHLVFAAATAAAGPGVPAVLAVNLVGSLLVLGGLMVAGRELAGGAGAAAAGLLWALTGGDIGLQANQPNTELLINACVAWALAATLRREGAPSSAAIGWTGCLAGIAVLLKPVALAPMTLLAAVDVGEVGRSRGAGSAVSAALRWAGCAAIPVTIVLAWALARGGVHPAWQALVVYNLAYTAGDPVTNLVGLAAVGRHLPPGSLAVLALLLLAGAVGLSVLPKPLRRPLLAVLAGSAAAVAAPGRFYPHYYQLLLPPLVLAASAGLSAAVNGPAIRRAAAALVVLGIAVVELPAVAVDPEDASRRKYGEVFIAENRLGEELKERVEAGELFWQLGPQPGLYLLTRTVPASGLVYNYPLLPGSPLRDELAARAIAALERQRPRLIVVRTSAGDRGVLPWIHRHYHRADSALSAPGYELWTMNPPRVPAVPVEAQGPITADGFEDGSTSLWRSTTR